MRPKQPQSPGTDAGELLASILPPSKVTPVQWAHLAAAQPLCPDVQRCKESDVLQVQELACKVERFGVMQPLVPVTFCHLIFDQVHGQSLLPG